MRIGIALPMTLNLPFAHRSRRPGCRLHADGSGDIAAALAGGDRIAYLHLWPHARPWQLARPEPMLRARARRGARRGDPGARRSRRTPAGPAPTPARRGAPQRPHEPAALAAAELT